jgi:hypothetical protein
MRLLRRVLSAGAILGFVLSVAVLAAPRLVVEGLLDQPPLSEDVWVRLLGVAGIALASFHVLVLRKLDDLWWWSWTFVLYDGLSTVVIALHAAVGVDQDAAVWPWWLFAATTGAFTVLYLVGIARAGQEKPLV